MDVINNAINSLNSSTFFAGIMMICLNIGSRYIQLNLDESTESYIKYALTKEILVFTISWMATRNIYTALVLTAVFVVLADFVLNEKSKYCLLPKKFIDMLAHRNSGHNKSHLIRMRSSCFLIRCRKLPLCSSKACPQGYCSLRQHLF